MGIKKLGSRVIGGGVPILGQKKPDLTKIPRFSAEQLQEFLFGIAFGVAEWQAAQNLTLRAIMEEMGFEYTLDEEEYQKEITKILPGVMAAFGFDEVDEEGAPDEVSGI